MKTAKNFFIGIAISLVILVSVLGGVVSDRLFGYRILDKLVARPGVQKVVEREIVTEESVVTQVVEKVGPSVVTVGIKKTQVVFDPFS